MEIKTEDVIKYLVASAFGLAAGGVGGFTGTDVKNARHDREVAQLTARLDLLEAKLEFWRTGEISFSSPATMSLETAAEPPMDISIYPEQPQDP